MAELDDDMIDEAAQAEAARNAAAERISRQLRRPHDEPWMPGPVQDAAAPDDPDVLPSDLNPGLVGGEVGLKERARLNALDSYYRGSGFGALRSVMLSDLSSRDDPPDITPERKRANDGLRKEYAELVADLARYDRMKSFETLPEAGVALAGQLGGALLSPESYLGWAAKGATAIARTGRAALQQAGIMAVTDPAVQALSMKAGTEEHFSFWRWGGATLLGAGIGGGFHGAGEAIGGAIGEARSRAILNWTANVRSRIAKLAEEDGAFAGEWVAKELRKAAGTEPPVASPPPEAAAPQPEPVPPRAAEAEPAPAGPAEPTPTAVAPAPVPPEQLEPVRHRVVTPDGTAVEVKPIVVEARDLVTSADQNYDATLQPRDRDRAASQQQIREIAGDLDPERLGFSIEADRGAPIVGPDNMVESGNGRVLAIRQAYAAGGESAQRYRDWLAKQGIDVSGFEQPVLIRQRLTDMTPAERQAFTVSANRSATLTFSAPERALGDARLINADALNLIRNPDDLGAAANRDFVRAFVGKLPQAEQGAMMNAEGGLSIEGLTRVRNAVLAVAYGDAPVLSRIAEATTDEIKSISNGLVAAAPFWARLRADVSEGLVRADIDQTAALVEAVTRTADLRAKGQKLDTFLAQQDAFDRLSPIVEDFMRMFYDGAGRRAAGGNRIADALKFYAEEGRKVSDGGLDLGLAPVAVGDLQRLAREKAGGPRTEGTLFLRRGVGDGAGAEAAGLEVQRQQPGQARGDVAAAGGAGDRGRQGGAAAAQLTPPSRRPDLSPDNQALIARRDDATGRAPDDPDTVAIKADMVKQLTASGMPAHEAEINAALVAARYRARAERLGAGESAIELYRREGIEVRRGEPAAIKGRAFDQPLRQAPPFYSAVARAVTAAKQAKASPDQWLATLRNTPGIKAEEMQWLGLEDWLKQQKGPVTKEQIADYVRANAIDVREVEIGNKLTPEQMRRADELEDIRVRRALTEAEQAEHKALREGMLGANTQPKFQEYTLPGGENYRELLLTLPPSRLAPEQAGKQLYENFVRRGGEQAWEQLAPETRRHWTERATEQGRGTDYDPEKMFLSSHFDEPNILAHVRFNDRVIDGKRTLFLEEIQSDWMQQGRRKGFKDDKLTADWEGEPDKSDRIVRAEDGTIIARASPLGTPEQLLADVIRDRVPAAPFKTSWESLALKRMIRYAAENGYDRIAWTTGKTQAERYDLSKQVDAIRAVKRPSDGAYVLSARLKEHTAFTALNDGTAVPGEKLPDYVGKDLADKIVKGGDGQQIYTGIDLKVGGEGMAGFYDRMLPAAANKLTKKFGGKVERGEIDTTPVTSAERQAWIDASADMPFAGEVVELSPEVIRLHGMPDDRRFAIVDEEGVIDQRFATRAEAEAVVALRLDTSAKAEPVHTLAITPALREAAVSEGFPLFQRGGEGEPRGRITLASNKAVIDLYARADRSTFLHESGHLWLDELVRDAASATAPQPLKDDLTAVLQWLGVEKAGDIGVVQHEQWARGFEAYLREGKAPSSALAKAFETFKQWLIQIYRGMRDLDVEISGDIRGVMDRMLATDAEIAAVRESETILAAAIRNEAGEVFQGVTHPDAAEVAARATGVSDFEALGKLEEGFVTSRGRFVTREQANEIAQRQGQIPADRPGARLYADDFMTDDGRPTGQLQPEDTLALAARQGGGTLRMERARPAAGVPDPDAATATGTAVLDVPDAAASTRPAPVIQSLQQQAMALADAIGFPLRQGRITGGRIVLGKYNLRTGVVRTREIADFEVVAHEAGHAIEDKVGPGLTALMNRFEGDLAPLVSNPGAYDPSQHVKEGFAEFIRRYIGNPAWAEKVAPGFTPAFRDFMRREAPEIMSAIEDAGTAYRAYLDAPSVDAVHAVVRSHSDNQRGWASAVATTRKHGFAATIGKVLENVYESLSDQFADVPRAMRSAARVIMEIEGGPVKLIAADDPNVLIRHFSRAKQAAIADVNDGVRPYHQVEPEGPSLRGALATALNDFSAWGSWDHDRKALFSDYLVARRAEYLWRRFDAGELPNPPVAFSKSDAVVTMAELDRANPTFGQAADMVHEYSRQLLRKAFEGGLIGRDLYDRLLLHEFYVPFMRDLRDQPRLRDMTAGGTGLSEVVKRMRGSTRDIIDPIESLVTQTLMVNRALRHNDLIRAFVRYFGRAGPEGGRYVEPVPAHEAKQYTFDLGAAVEKTARERGVDPDEIKVMLSGLADVFGEDEVVGSFFKMEPAGKRGEPIVFYKEGGETRAVRFMAKSEGFGLYELVTSLPPALADGAAQALAISSGALRAGVVTAPAYVLTNFIRDQLAAFILRPDFIPFYHSLKGTVAEVMQDEAAKLYAYAGGVSAGARIAPIEKGLMRDWRNFAEIAMGAPKDIAPDINLLKAGGEGPIGYLSQRLQSVGAIFRGDLRGAFQIKNLHGLLELMSITEAGTRNSIFDTVYRQKKAQGLSDYEAMMEAASQGRDIMDFGQRGSRTMWVVAATPFFNAAQVGLDKARRAMFAPIFRRVKERGYLMETDKEEFRNALLAWSKFAALGGVLGAAWAAVHGDDDVYSDASPQLMATHFVTSIDGYQIVIPKPFELGLGFTAGEYAYRRLVQNDRRAAEQFAAAAWDVLVPPTPIFDNPLLKTTFELGAGVSYYPSFFAPRQLVPDTLKRLPAEMQYTDRTSSAAKAIGKVIGVSPIKVDHAIGGYFGTWGRDLMALSSSADESKPVGRWDDTIFLRRFIKDPTKSSDATHKFWDFMGATTGKYNQAVAAHSEMVSRRSPDSDALATDFLNKLPDGQRAYVTLRNAADENGRAAFKPEHRRLHPLQRAYDAVTVLNGVRREMDKDNFAPFETGERQPLNSQQRGQVRDAVLELGQMEMRNALVIMKEPGYDSRPLLDTGPVIEKIRKLAPSVADEIATRYATSRIYTTKSVVAAWPQLRSRLLRNGSDADLGDLVDAAASDGHDLGGERVRRPPKRRIVIPPEPAFRAPLQ